MARFHGAFFEDIGHVTRQLWDYVGDLLSTLIAFLFDFWNGLGKGVDFSGTTLDWFASVYGQLMGPKNGTIYGYLVFFLLTFAAFEGLRQLNALIFHRNEFWRLIGNEVIGTGQLCVCAYAEASIWDIYGIPAFYLVTVISLSISQALNQGAVDKTAVLFEEAIGRNADLDDFRYVIGGQLIGSALSYFFAHSIWLVTWKISGENLRLQTCLLTYEHPYIVVCFVEFMASFLFRLFLTQVDDPSLPKRKKFIPWLYATFFTICRLITGSRGVHMALNASRITGCTLTDTVEICKFMFCYIFTGIAGSFAASKLSERPTTMRSFWRLRYEAREQQKAQEAVEEPPVRQRGRPRKARRS